MRFVGTCYRGHDPKWAFSPLSGDGAASQGGRFNEAGAPALYLALTTAGIFVEMSHGFAHRFDPLTVCTYEVNCNDIVDLRTKKTRRTAGIALSDLACGWKDDLTNGRNPTSWSVARRLINNGAAGILVPSFAVGARRGMSNLVLWRWGPNPPHQVHVFDPSGRLPRDQLSWKP